MPSPPSSAGWPVPRPPTLDVQLIVVLTADTLLGFSDRPAKLDGYGPIPAELARAFAAGEPAAGGSANSTNWQRAKIRLTRLLVDPIDGLPVGMDARRRDFTGVLRELVLRRDPHCTQPFCSAPSRHADHVVPYAAGGSTELDNAQGLCASGNYAKEIPGWRTERNRDGTVVTTPTGHRYLTQRTPSLGLPPTALRV